MKRPRTPRPLLPGFSLLLALTLLLSLLSGCMSDDLQALADAVGDTAAMMEQLSGDPAEAAPEENPSDVPATSPEDAAQDTPEDTPQDAPEDVAQVPSEDDTPVEGEAYFATEDVALYLHLYQQLPPNFMTKNAARDLGWSGGDLWSYAPDRAIGGDRFGNREGLLPEGSWHECDVNYAGGSRGAERLVWNDDGDIYYTGDHYESFTQLYAGWAS